VTIKPVLYGGLAARLVGVPSVVAAISGLGFVFMSNGSKVKLVRFFVVRIYKFVLNKQNLKVIFQNPDDRNAIMKAVSLEVKKIVTIRGSGVDLSKFSVKPLPAGLPIVVMASRLLRDKGVIEFLKAVQLLKKRGVGARFWLVGNPDPGNPTSIDFEQLLKTHDAKGVELLGQRDDIFEVFSQSHIVVLPSYREGLPKVLLEAAACGRAVVTTDVPGCRHAVEVGVTALLVPPYDPVSLADAIESLIIDQDLCCRMGLAGRDLAEREFSIDKVVATHLTIYDELVASA
jgi:glycosyltransferase involved in cell wall biosynthesis